MNVQSEWAHMVPRVGIEEALHRPAQFMRRDARVALPGVEVPVAEQFVDLAQVRTGVQ
jgi:hypothetical protein